MIGHGSDRDRPAEGQGPYRVGPYWGPHAPMQKVEG
jgi:hypothetical protein